MKARIVIDQQGKISIFTEDGTFTQGAEKIAQVYAALQALGVPLAVETQPEQHRHDNEGEGQHSHTHQHTHSH